MDKLKNGNLDYLGADEIYAEVREDTATNGQKPYAVIVTCSDSRVPPEHIFSAGIGDLFVVRTAGNVVGDFERGTVEYAVEHLGVKLVVVMGHTHCGAVGAALGQELPHGSLGRLVTEIKFAIGSETDELKAVKLNISNSIKSLLDSRELKNALEADELEIKGAVYDIHSGKVEWL